MFHPSPNKGIENENLRKSDRLFSFFLFWIFDVSDTVNCRNIGYNLSYY